MIVSVSVSFDHSEAAFVFRILQLLSLVSGWDCFGGNSTL